MRDKAPMLICEKLNVHVENLKVRGTIYFIYVCKISLVKRISSRKMFPELSRCA